MSEISWERRSVLIVEANSFVRFILTNTLNAIGIRNVATAPDGKAAIDLMNQVKDNPLKAGISAADIILCDFFMPEVDGNLFLHWVRSGKHSPDRFVPFIMVSGAADPEIVAEARDIGINTSLGKPFSPKSVADWLLYIENTRFIFGLSHNYFGLDRRRLKKEVETERRISEPEEIQQAHGPSALAGPRKGKRVAYFMLPNRLREKLGATDAKKKVEIGAAALETAENSIKDMEGEYPQWVDTSIH